MSVVTVNSRASAGGRSRYSAASKAQSIGSMAIGDFNGKKAKILQTLKGIDEMKSGICKTEVFLNLLDCLDVEISDEDLATICRKHSLASNGVNYLKYHSVLKALRFDNHTETWILASQEDQAPKNRYRATNSFDNT